MTLMLKKQIVIVDKLLQDLLEIIKK